MARKPKNGSAVSSTYLDLGLVHIDGLKQLVNVRWRKNAHWLTKLLTMILESPVPAAGPLGALALPVALVALVLF